MSIRLASGVAFVAALAITATPAAAQLTQVTARAQVTSPVTWLWPSDQIVANPFTRTSNGVTITTSWTGGTGETRTAGLSWGGGFSPGDFLLYRAGGNSVTLDFAAPITGFASQLWSDFAPSPNPGTFSAQFFSGASNLGTFNWTTGGGSAPNSNQATVFGALATTGSFDRIIITAPPTGTNPAGFGINQFTIRTGAPVSTVPEPSTYALLATGLAGIALATRRRVRR